MKIVEILCLLQSGPKGRKRGNILDIKEGTLLEPPRWCRDGVPKRCFVIRLEDKTVAGLPSAWKKFGAHRSQVTLDTTKLPAAAQQGIWGNGKATVTSANVTTSAKNNGPKWIEEGAEAVIISP